MEEKTKNKKNHWTSTKVDGANKKINQEIYQRNRQAPLQIKLDDLAIFIHDRVTGTGDFWLNLFLKGVPRMFF